MNSRMGITLFGLMFMPVLGLTLAREDGQNSQQLWEKTVDAAISYLRSNQQDDGGWATKQSPGITGVVIEGMLKTGRVTTSDPSVQKGLQYIEGLINPRAGHIAGKDPRVQLQNYVTCVNIMALKAAGKDSYKPVIKDAASFLKKLQWDDGEGKTPRDDFWGGAGYDSKSRPDLSNTQYFLDALVAAGVPKDDPAFKKAAVFVSRCQNLKGETNDQPWAGKIDDGTFIYSTAAGGETKVQDRANDDGSLPGYGSMTYAGIKSLIYCGVDKDDPRIKKAFSWIQTNYSLEKNPGMPSQRSRWGLYYYYHTMAKTLDLMGTEEITDSQGKKHSWRQELTAELARLQQKDGSWINEADRWMEGNPQIVTGYALMALSHCKPKSR